jgi:hypothetical protein
MELPEIEPSGHTLPDIDYHRYHTRSGGVLNAELFVVQLNDFIMSPMSYFCTEMDAALK